MSYWTTRWLEEVNRLQEIQAEDMDKAMAKAYEASARRIVAQIKDLYQEILAAKKDGTLLVSDLYKYKRYYELLNELNAELTKLGHQQIKIIEPHLIQMYLDNAGILQEHFGFSVEIPLDTAMKAVNAVWCVDGLNWSQRVWRNLADLQVEFQQGLFDIVATGSGTKDLTKTLAEKYLAEDAPIKTAYYKAQRLIRTELAHVQVQSTLDEFVRDNIEYYEVVDSDDYPGRECRSCAEDHPGIYKVAEAEPGINVPPFHPNCRCTVIPYVNSISLPWEDLFYTKKRA